MGENQFSTREVVLNSLGYLGITLDKEANDSTLHGKAGIISTPDSKVKVVVIPTDEEYMIAHDTEAIVEGREP